MGDRADCEEGFAPLSGGHMCPSGVLAVAFYEADLHLYGCYLLGLSRSSVFALRPISRRKLLAFTGAFQNDKPSSRVYTDSSRLLTHNTCGIMLALECCPGSLEYFYVKVRERRKGKGEKTMKE